MAQQYRHSHPDNRRKARSLLESMRAAAVSEAQQQVEALGVEALTAVGRNSHLWYRLSFLTGVHVYPGRKGGWFADLTFEGLPPGIPAVIGTPAAHPCGTREEAVEAARSMVVFAAANDLAIVPEHDSVQAVFEFDGVVVGVPSKVVGRLQQRAMPSQEEILRKMETVRRKHAHVDHLSRVYILSLPKEEQDEIAVAAAMALAVGIPIWPPRDEVAVRPANSMH